MIGELYKSTPISSYQPSQDVVDFTAQVKKDYAEGVDILNRPYIELNNRSVIEDENRGQLMFNSFVEESVQDVNQEWEWRGTRGIARNKGIAMHAQLTANYLLPLYIAQNEDDEVDMEFSEVMRDLAEWLAQPTNSDYQQSFVQIVFGMLANPVTYLGAEYYEVFQKIIEKREQGYSVQYVIDEVLSGYQAPIWSASQILITNAYERNIQKQRRIIKRRWVERQELEAKYGEHPNWGHVQVGIRSIYNEEDGLFYDVKDDEHPNLVAEEICLTRRDDNEVPFINGIYMGNDNIEDNPIKHRDNLNRPKYNVTPFGYNRIGEHFFFYKSMMNVVGWDNDLYDAMSEVVMNGAFLEQNPPIAVYGTDQIDSSINFPGAVVAFEQTDVEAKPIFPPKNFIAGFNVLRETEKSITDSSLNETLSGQLPDASQKAFNVAQAQANAKKILSGTAKSLEQSMLQYGDLMKDLIINHITIPQVEELTSGAMKLKYRQFLLEGKEGDKKTVNKRIKFDESLMGRTLSKKEKQKMELKMLEDIDYPDGNEELTKVNPELFAKCKYLTKIDLEVMFSKNQEFMQPLLTNLYGMLANDPRVEGGLLLRKLMRSYFQSDGDKLVKDEPQMQPGAPARGDMLGQMAQNTQLAQAIKGS